MKLDVENKEFVKVWEDSNCMATEPYFVPRPGSKGQLKFIYSEKATKFCEISTNYLTGSTYIGQIIGGDFAKFCGFLRIYEL